ncbi:MAG: dihydrodipicolinate synthase family protein [Flavobacteriaceae bacterium]|nr:dihydrodipicolinate synthase family protein [Flavobacteriaceae bacterium]MCY4266426.1 dihydrodipicolinate synthase family protein [Flavobacteriaceae bacterium]
MRKPIKILWRGVYPAITTQFSEHSKLDLVAFSKNLKAQISAGIHGVVLGGSLGEASTLLQVEKTRLLKKALSICNNKIPVLVNIAESSTSSAIRAAELAQYGGADGLMLLPPMRYKATELETVQYLKDVAQSTTLPIMLYNNPVDYRINISIDMLESLIEIPNVQAIKESSRDVTNVQRITNRLGSCIHILCGVDTIALESFVFGAQGWVAGLCNAFPAETVALYELVQKNEIQKAHQLLRWFLPLLELDLSPQLVQNIKYCELTTQMGTGFVRKPRLPLSDEKKSEIDEILKKALNERPNISL